MRALLLILGAALCAFCLSCDDAMSDPPVDTPDAGPDMAVEGCGVAADAHTALLTAPTTATVIRKIPTHPPVGPEGLP